MTQQLENYIAQARAMAQANSAQSQSFAREQMAFQEAQNAKAMQFNAEQAQLNRSWQERMSNTAHQREMADLKAAGLNPVLTAMGGQGASVTSGATASGYSSSGASGSVDTSATQLMGSLIQALTSTSVARINQDTALQTANINARTNVAIQEMKNDLEVYLKKTFPDTWTQVLTRGIGQIADILSNNPSTVESTSSKVVDFIKDIPAVKNMIYNYQGFNGGHRGTNVKIKEYPTDNRKSVIQGTSDYMKKYQYGDYVGKRY